MRAKPPHRRPSYAPGRRWCCAACREVAQLREIIDHQPMSSTPESCAARLILARYAMVQNGLYGGIHPGNLFD